MMPASFIDNNLFIKNPAIIRPFGAKNLLDKQTQSDKKAFPVILGQLKRDLQTEAAEKEIDNTVHGLIKIIITLHIERRRLIKENPYMDTHMLLAISNIKEEEICLFMKDYKRAGNKVTLNNLELIRLAITTLLEKRKLHIERQKVRKVAKNTAQICLF